MAAASLGVFVVLAVLAERRGNLEYPIIDLLTGCVFIVVGVWLIRTRRLAGLLLLAASASWFLVTAELTGNWSGELLYAHRGLLIGALLAVGELSIPIVAGVGVACVGAFDYERANSTSWLAATGLTVLIVMAHEATRRRVSWRYVAAAAVSVASWSIVPGVLAPHGLLNDSSRFIVYCLGLALGTVTVTLAMTQVMRPAELGSADIVRDGGPLDVRIAFRAPGYPDFEDADGRPSNTIDGKNVAVWELGDDLGEALVTLPAAVDPTRAAPYLIPGLRLLAANRRAVQVLRAQAGEVAASERRIREADAHASAQVGLELDRLVVRRIDKAMNMLGDDELEQHAALQGVLVEIRALASGLVPPALAQGLGSALISLAADHPVPVSVDVADAQLSPSAERALYFTAAECLANAERYASASRLQISLVVDNAEIQLTVSDNGGGGAALVPGGGLTGLSSRLAVLGGRLEVRAAREGGTVVTARLPSANSSAGNEPQAVS